MNNETIYNWYVSSLAIEDMGIEGWVIQLMAEKLKQHGYTLEDVEEAFAFVEEKVRENPVESGEMAVKTYVDSFLKVRKMMDMAKGYEEMGDLNLELAEEGEVFEFEKVWPQENQISKQA